MSNIWDTNKIVQALKQNGFTDAEIFVSDAPGGDYDTNMISVKRANANIDIVGFRDLGDNCITRSEWDLAEVDWIFCCENDKSGMINAKPADFRLCADVLMILESIGYTNVSTAGWDCCI